MTDKLLDDFRRVCYLEGKLDTAIDQLIKLKKDLVITRELMDKEVD